LLDGSYRNQSYQTGADTTNVLAINIVKQGTTATGFGASALEVNTANVATNVFTSAGASQALSKVDSAIEVVSEGLQRIGAYTSRLSVKESTLSIAITNTEATKSRIMDADLAREQLNATRNLILQQTSTAQLAQANITPQNVLALFT
jgi:flagellin